MRGRKKLYKIVDQNGKQAFEDLLDCQQAAEKTGTTKQNVYQAVENYALVNKKISDHPGRHETKQEA